MKIKLEIENINFSAAGKKILEDICLQVKDGEFVGVIGPNGSGKSTLLKAVYRIIKPTSGIIKFNEKYLPDLSAKETAKFLAVVGQFNAVNFDVSILEVVLMGRTPHKSRWEFENQKDRNIAMAALRQVGLEQAAKRSFNSLSGGEKQRVILARALAQEPQFLILDEPTNHLDIRYQLQLLSIVKSLQIGSLAALHDLSLAAMFCARIYVLKQGHIIASGCPNEVLTPSLLKQVYGVDCKVDVDEQDGYLRIHYLPPAAGG